MHKIDVNVFNTEKTMKQAAEKEVKSTFVFPLTRLIS
jgi:hypothetical protein